MQEPVADDFYRLTHHDVTGRPHLSGRATGLGMAAALLGELTLSGNLWIKDNIVSVRAHRAPADALAHTLLAQLAARPHYTDAARWVRLLAPTATAEVAKRLSRQGHLRLRTTRRLLAGRAVSYVPTDMNTAAAPWAVLSTRLRHQLPLNPAEAFLAGLCAATGLESHLIDLARPESRTHLSAVVDALRPPLRELVQLTHVAVGDAVLASR